MQAEFKEIQERIAGSIIPAIATPWDENFDVVEDDLAGHVRQLGSVDGIEAVIVNAHTGECKLAPSEAKQEVIRVANDALDDTMVFSGISADSTLIAIEEGERAVEAGADCLMPLPMPSEVYSTPEVAVNHYAAIGEEVGAPLLNFQFPTWGGAGLPIGSLVEICKLDHVVGFKEASWDPIRYDRTVRAVKADPAAWENCTMLTGNDTFLYQSYALGSQGALIAYANLIPERHVEKLRAVERGDFERARELQDEMRPLTNFVFGKPYGKYLAKIKEALVMTGVYEEARLIPPQVPLTVDEKQQLREILAELGELERGAQAVASDD